MVFEELLELGAFDEVEVVLAPFGTAVRMIESRLGLSDDVRSGEGKITVGIEEAGALGLTRNGRPAITGPIRF